MNIALINLSPSEWSKSDWTDAYAEYCKANMFGPKTKREFYDMVLERHKRLEESQKPMPAELLQRWSKGRLAAKEWARKRGCDLNGRLLSDAKAEVESRAATEIANDAENIAVDTMQRLDFLLEQARKRRMQE